MAQSDRSVGPSVSPEGVKDYVSINVLCAARTLRDNLVDGGASLVRHETDDGENDEASKDARAAVDHGHNQSVPETPSKCFFFFDLPTHLKGRKRPTFLCYAEFF